MLMRLLEMKQESPYLPRKKRMKDIATGSGKRQNEIMPTFPN